MNCSIRQLDHPKRDAERVGSINPSWRWRGERHRRLGLTLVEVLIASMLLFTVLTMTTSLVTRVQRVWRTVASHRVATFELNNQLESLTRLRAEEIEPALRQLVHSDWCGQTLLEPKLTGNVSKDNLGTRVTLQLTWHAIPRPHSLELSGWLVNPSQPKNNRNEEAGNATD